MTARSAQEADYVIVGAGSAGCVLAARLTEDPGTEVALLEAGGRDWNPLVQVPLGWGMVYSRKLHDWRLKTEPEAALNNRVVEFARGKLLGGSSSVNAMAYVRGHRSDYDGWAERGLSGWSFDEILPWFRKQESWEGGASPYRGGDGPLSTQYATYQDDLVQATIDAGRETGHPWTDDYNGAQQEGFARIQSTIRRGRRCSASVAYLRPALRRPNLHLQMHARATRIIMEGTTAKGIEYLHRGERRRVMARKEVILSAGVALSPQLLLLSGIGPAAELRAQNIATAIDLPKVGRNLRDHVSPVLLFRRKQPGPFHAAMRYDRIARKMAEALLRGTGIASDVPCGMIAFLRSPLASSPVPDVQFLLNAAPLTAKPYLRAANSFPDGFGLRVVLLRPESSGTISLASSDPLAQPRIHQNFLQHDHEWRLLRHGIRMARDIAAQSALGGFMGGEVVPGPDCSNSDADLDGFIRNRALTTHHPLGTCAMATSAAEGVVDDRLRVFGAERLRVIDASVIPEMIGGNINAGVIMIAERMADHLRGRPAA
ncbi:GMC family oxidoreductase [Roseomonas sp. BN140053]|uniref:GMC family oxidoreductase n=1 Tax=Roseomonas sp. BN140053 TaxID=3391898 RepID=UPI0039E94BCA